MNHPDSAHAAGEAPKRATGSVVLGFGLVQIPLSVFSGTDDGLKVSRRTFTADGHEVGKASYDKTTGKLLPPGETVVMKATASDGKTLVELTDEELETFTGGTVRGLSEIEAFVPVADIGTTYHVVSEAQVRAQDLTVGKKKVPNAGAQKALALLLAVLGEREAAALFKITLRGPARFAALMPDGRMVTLAFTEQVRKPLPLDLPEVTDKEMALARQLVDSIGVSSPVLADTVAAQVQAFVDDKAAGKAPEAPAEVVVAPAEDDMLERLAASLAAVKAA